MDPVTAFGLATAILTLADIGIKVARRLQELSEAGDVPGVFRGTGKRLRLIISVIKRTEKATDDLSPLDEEAFREVVRQCFQQAGQLDEILQKVTVTKGDSRLRRAVRAGISIIEEGHVQKIAAALKDNIQLLTFLNTAPVEKSRPKVARTPSVPLPSSVSTVGLFLVPFSRDERFVGRDSNLQLISSRFETEERVTLSGIGGVGKSQIAIEYCYRYKQSRSNSHVLWVYGGNIARFYQGYKRIAQMLEVPGWDDPEGSILELVCSWLSSTTRDYLLVIDNADNIEHWWPGKYKSGGSLDNPSNDLSKYLPDSSAHGRVLITTRDNRVAGRLLKETKPITVQSMSYEEARMLLLSKLEGKESDLDEAYVTDLLNELDHLPLAVAQAAAFITENNITIAQYTNALQGEDAEEFLHEELDDSRRDQESVNSVVRTWKLSYNQIKQQKPRAAQLLSLLAMFDRHSIPKSLLKVPEFTTSLGVLQAFNLVATRAGLQSLQMHRLVQRSVQLSLQGDKTIQMWQQKALACLSEDYPTEIGVAEWPVCDALAPHVHVITSYEYHTKEAQLDLAHLLCWSADFDIERGMYNQALQRAEQSLMLFRQHVPRLDERLVAATWLYGRLRYYQARSAKDMDVAAQLLECALRTSSHPSLNYAESAFELAHLYYDQCNENACLEMGKASYECWEALEGKSSVRTLDNMHDYALELAMCGHEEEGIEMWQEILDRCRTSNASDSTKTVYTCRSMAGITEFEGDAAAAEDYYARLVDMCENMYHAEHVHVFDYRLSHAEQIMRQGKYDQAVGLSEGILMRCDNASEWRISASCLQTIAECHRLSMSYDKEYTYRLKALELYEKKLGRDHKDTIDAIEALADCYFHNSRYSVAKDLYQRIFSWRNTEIAASHTDTIRALECLAICHSHLDQNKEAEAAYLDSINRQDQPDGRMLKNLCISLQIQGKWVALESWSRQAYEVDKGDRLDLSWSLITALEKQGKTEEALEMRARLLAVEAPDEQLTKGRLLPTMPPVRDDRRFGRMIHPRTWSA